MFDAGVTAGDGEGAAGFGNVGIVGDTSPLKSGLNGVRRFENE